MPSPKYACLRIVYQYARDWNNRFQKNGRFFFLLPRYLLYELGDFIGCLFWCGFFSKCFSNRARRDLRRRRDGSSISRPTTVSLSQAILFATVFITKHHPTKTNQNNPAGVQLRGKARLTSRAWGAFMSPDSAFCSQQNSPKRPSF